jgi:hypothetical protein
VPLLARHRTRAAAQKSPPSPPEWAAGWSWTRPPRRPRWQGRAQLGPPLPLPTVYSTTSPSLRLWQPSDQWGPPLPLRHCLALVPLLPDPQLEPGGPVALSRQ